MSARPDGVAAPARLLSAAALGFAALLACDRPSDSVRTNTSSASQEGVEPGPVPVAGGACPAGRANPPFADGAWSVRSLVCARSTLSVGDRFVLRAMPTGGNNCSCPENTPCAPCMPYTLFRDTPGDAIFVTLRAEPPPSVVAGARSDVPVRLFAWGSAPPAAVAELVRAP